MYLGDDFHHNGAFRLSYGFEYAAMMETSRVSDQFTFDLYDTYEWYLKLGALSNVNDKYLHSGNSGNCAERSSSVSGRRSSSV